MVETHKMMKQDPTSPEDPSISDGSYMSDPSENQIDPEDIHSDEVFMSETSREDDIGPLEWNPEEEYPQTMPTIFEAAKEYSVHRCEGQGINCGNPCIYKDKYGYNGMSVCACDEYPHCERIMELRIPVIRPYVAPDLDSYTRNKFTPTQPDRSSSSEDSPRPEPITEEDVMSSDEPIQVHEVITLGNYITSRNERK